MKMIKDTQMSLCSVAGSNELAQCAVASATSFPRSKNVSTTPARHGYGFKSMGSVFGDEHLSMSHSGSHKGTRVLVHSHMFDFLAGKSGRIQL